MSGLAREGIRLVWLVFDLQHLPPRTSHKNVITRCTKLTCVFSTSSGTTVITAIVIATLHSCVRVVCDKFATFIALITVFIFDLLISFKLRLKERNYSFPAAALQHSASVFIHMDAVCYLSTH